MWDLPMEVRRHIQANGVQSHGFDLPLADDLCERVEISPDAGICVDLTLKVPVEDCKVSVCCRVTHGEALCDEQ